MVWLSLATHDAGEDTAPHAVHRHNAESGYGTEAATSAQAHTDIEEPQLQAMTFKEQTQGKTVNVNHHMAKVSELCELAYEKFSAFSNIIQSHFVLLQFY